jgi:hypothetical protein
VIAPPAPKSPEPTEIPIEPALPEFAVPVVIENDPVLPALEVPVEIAIPPLTPEAPALLVCKSRAPLVVAVLNPVLISTLPAIPPSEAPPAMETFPPVLSIPVPLP